MRPSRLENRTLIILHKMISFILSKPHLLRPADGRLNG